LNVRASPSGSASSSSSSHPKARLRLPCMVSQKFVVSPAPCQQKKNCSNRSNRLPRSMVSGEGVGSTLRPIPRERLRAQRASSPSNLEGEARQVGEPSRATSEVDHSIVGSPASASAHCESADSHAPCTTTTGISATIRALRNDNWHLSCEIDILRLALESERRGQHMAYTPEGGGRPADQEATTVGEFHAQLVAVSGQLQAERERVRDLEAECRAWSNLHQSVMASAQGLGKEKERVRRGGERDGSDNAGAKELFGTISRLIAAEESEHKPQHSSAAHSAVNDEGSVSSWGNPHDWLHRKDKEEVSLCVRVRVCAYVRSIYYVLISAPIPSLLQILYFWCCEILLRLLTASLACILFRSVAHTLTHCVARTCVCLARC
jgi:hypothetical protein